MTTSAKVSYRLLYALLLILLCGHYCRVEAFVPPRPSLTAQHSNTILHGHHEQLWDVFSSSTLTVATPFSVRDLVSAPPSLAGGIGESVRNAVGFGVNAVGFGVGGAVVLFLVVPVIIIIFVVLTQGTINVDDIPVVDVYVPKYHPEVWKECQDEFGKENPLEGQQSEKAEEWLNNRLERTLRNENDAIEKVLKEKHSDVWEIWKVVWKVVRTLTDAETPMLRAQSLAFVLEQENIPRPPPTDKEEELMATTNNNKEE